MGGTGSGGHNKKRAALEDYPYIEARACKGMSHRAIAVAYELGPLAIGIHLAWQPCHYGGYRPWLLCPVCGRRAYRLFIREELPACRECNGLAYSIHQQRGLARHIAQATKHAAKLLPGPTWDAPPAKPPGMRNRTYARHLAKWFHACELAMSDIQALPMHSQNVLAE